MAMPIPADTIKTIRKTAEKTLDDLGEFRDDVVHKVRREPLKSIGLAVGAGAAIGAVAGFAMYAGFARLCANGRSK